MPYAHNGMISQDPISGGIEITKDQYDEALAAILDGKVVSIEGGFHVVDPADAPPPQEEPVDPRDTWKQERELAVSQIVVTTSSGNEFDGDEVSQGRMARAIIALQSKPEGAVTKWALHDNRVVNVGVKELTEALAMAGARQTELWFKN